MSNYLPQKAPAQLSKEELLERESEFNRKLKDLDNSPIAKVDDFQKPLVKDLPVQKINTKEVVQQIGGNDFVEKIAKLRALKQAGKKAMGIIPFAGAGYAALSGDPAMASEELAGDIPFVGQAYEAIKPTDSGNVEEERQMIAERNAQVAYGQSPAHLARMNVLRKMGR